MNMRSIKNRLLLKGRKNKQTIITILLALAIVVGTSNALDFCIDHKDVAIAVNKDIAGNDIPNEVTAVRKTSLAIRFLKTKGGHVSVNHNLCGGSGIGYANLTENGLDSATIETCKAMKLIGSVREEHVMHLHLFEQCYNAAAIHQVVDLVNGIVGYVGVVFVTAGAGDAKVEYLHHRNPVASGFGHLLSQALLPLKGCYMRLASSRLRFM